MLSEEEIRATVASCCGVNMSDCHSGTSIYELGIDSLALTSLISHCEMRLSMDFSDATIMQLMSAQTVGEIISLLQAQAVN